MSEKDVAGKILEELQKKEYGLTKEIQSKLGNSIKKIVDVAPAPVPPPVVVEEEQKPQVNRDIRSNIRLFITDKPNSKGSNISGYDTIVNADEYPFTSADEVSVFIKALMGNSNDKVYIYTPSGTEQVVKIPPKKGGNKQSRKRSTRKKGKK
jgi:hypothetical protein